jgi:hypothetical protein
VHNAERRLCLLETMVHERDEPHTLVDLVRRVRAGLAVEGRLAIELCRLVRERREDAGR